MFAISDIASIANYYSPLITAIATIFLVIITAYYAWQNRKYVKLIEKERKETIFKETISKVLELIYKELVIITNIKSYGYKIPEFKTWQLLKFEKPSLIYMIINKLNIGEDCKKSGKCGCSDIDIHFQELV